MLSIRVKNAQFRRAAAMAGVPAAYLPEAVGKDSPQRRIQELLKVALERGLAELELEHYPRTQQAERLFAKDAPLPGGCEVCGRTIAELEEETHDEGSIEPCLDRQRKIVTAACSNCRPKLAVAG